MGFRFKRQERFADGFVRVGLEQAKRVERYLDEKKQGAHSVHEARKCLKRLRALIRLAKPSVGPKWWKEVDGLCSSMAGKLAGLRDLDSLLEALDKLIAANGTKPSTTSERLKAMIEGERAGLNTMSLADALDEVRDDLDLLRKRLERVRFSERGFDIVGLGLAATCDRARRLERHAYETGHEEDFHRWRKRVQHHWRHMQLFAAAWPEVMTARAELARELSEILGDEHDMGLLAEEVRRRAKALKSRRGVEDLAAAALDRQQVLRRLAKARSRRLFADRGKDFSRRLRKYWKNPVEAVEKDHGDTSGLPRGSL